MDKKPITVQLPDHSIRNGVELNILSKGAIPQNAKEGPLSALRRALFASHDLDLLYYLTCLAYLKSSNLNIGGSNL